MNKIYLFLALFAVALPVLNAQQNPLNFRLQMLAGYNGKNNVPFWMRSNQYGSIPPKGGSLGLIGQVQKDYNPARTHLTDWGFSAEGRFNAGKPTDFILIEGYGKFRFSIFEVKAGRTKETTGLCDTSLTSGSFSVSGNAPGVPKVQIAIPEFYTLPILGSIFAFKGSYSHGWIGNWYINGKAVPNTPTYLHQKTLYGRFGKPGWKLKLYGGFNHQVIWGNEKAIMGRDYDLNGIETFLYVNTGKAYNHDSIRETRIGDHLGSIDLGLGYDFNNVRLLIYRQNIYDAGALYYLANILDGLNGLSVVNKHENGNGLQWKKFLVEFLHTKNQAGESWSRDTPSPYENYYNNGYYETGWSYKGVGLGTPFISPAGSIRNHFPSTPGSYFVNNRVIVVHIGMETYLRGWNFISKFSYSRNYGTYSTSATGKIYDGGINPSTEGIFPETGQFSAFLETKKRLQKGVQIGLLAALDKGNLFNDSFGLIGSISKSFH